MSCTCIFVYMYTHTWIYVYIHLQLQLIMIPEWKQAKEAQWNRQWKVGLRKRSGQTLVIFTFSAALYYFKKTNDWKLTCETVIFISTSLNKKKQTEFTSKMYLVADFSVRSIYLSYSCWTNLSSLFYSRFSVEVMHLFLNLFFFYSSGFLSST